MNLLYINISKIFLFIVINNLQDRFYDQMLDTIRNKNSLSKFWVLK